MQRGNSLRFCGETATTQEKKQLLEWLYLDVNDKSTSKADTGFDAN